jgi:peptidoglycan hydrolase-like protein with peptidoglycan-binding domain
LLAAFSHAQGNALNQPSAASAPKVQHTASTHKKSTRKKSHRTAKRGQQKIDSQRALQIQQALVREHYLTGKPSGVWDSATQAAMQKYQGDNGWQSKTTPDSRALIKLGLGPDQQHLLNPESAMTSEPQARTLPASTASGAAEPASSQPHQ